MFHHSDSKNDDFVSISNRKKTVVVGDGECGKTSLLSSYINDKFPEEYVPTIFENYSKKIKYKNKLIELHIWDTAGQEDYDRLRPLSYTDAECVLICFSVDDKNSFYNVADKWIPEVKHFSKCPILLVGLKSDLRQTDNECILEHDAKLLVAKWKLADYVECSAKTMENVNTVFNDAASLAMKKKSLKSHCKVQ